MSILLVLPMAHALTLTYGDALERAGVANLDVRDAALDVAAADGAVLAAGATFEPTVSASGAFFSSTNEGAGQFGSYFAETSGWNAAMGINQTFATGTSLDVDFSSNLNRFLYKLEGQDIEFTDDPQYQSSLAFTVSQALLQGDRLSYNLQAVRSARAARSIAEANRQARRQQVLSDTARAFWNARSQEALSRIAAQTLELAREQRAQTRVLVENGRLAPVEATRAEAAMVQAERAVLEARAADSAARDALLVLIGEAPGTELTLATVPPPPPRLELDGEAVIAAVRAGNPQLAAMRLALESSRAQVKDARHAMLPELGASASYALHGYEASLGGSLDELGGGELADWNVGATLTLPLLNRADRGALGQRQAEAMSAELDLARLDDTLVQAARAQIQTLETAQRDVELAQLNVRLAEETLAAEQALLSEGRALQRDVSEALKGQDTARADAERALTSYLIAVVELERLKGGL